MASDPAAHGASLALWTFIWSSRVAWPSSWTSKRPVSTLTGFPPCPVPFHLTPSRETSFLWTRRSAARCRWG
uniref:Putative secreted protein n=1 Tax=Ixodes scapularis TaxID=6945 RepID=A0A4D5S3L7_IXOSC